MLRVAFCEFDVLELEQFLDALEPQFLEFELLEEFELLLVCAFCSFLSFLLRPNITPPKPKKVSRIVFVD